MDEVPENEIIQMEDSSLVEAIGEARIDTGNGTTAIVHPPANDTDYQDRSKESIAASVPFDDEDITFHKVEVVLL
jgi:hypothetical protein